MEKAGDAGLFHFSIINLFIFESLYLLGREIYMFKLPKLIQKKNA